MSWGFFLESGKDFGKYWKCKEIPSIVILDYYLTVNIDDYTFLIDILDPFSVECLKAKS